MIIGSGGDDISSLGYRFAEAMELAGECGFTSVKIFLGRRISGFFRYNFCIKLYCAVKTEPCL
ncbi:MAG: hypothetical protein L6V93_03030 [Clostridiales bacterium]|nr:MAG: hypothetical protein L6V93_03030 [Clostridiales bacterium]